MGTKCPEGQKIRRQIVIVAYFFNARSGYFFIIIQMKKSVELGGKNRQTNDFALPARGKIREIAPSTVILQLFDISFF